MHETPPTEPPSTEPPARFQITLPLLFWWLFVVGLLLAYLRLLAATAGASLGGVLFLAAPAVGVAIVLWYDYDTWPGAAIMSLPPGALYVVGSLFDVNDLSKQSELLFAVLLVGSWSTLFGAVAMRLQRTAFDSLIELALLVLIIFAAFCYGLPTMV
ncbi:hypothetical protein [Blastopirellula marina]|uniref:Uncharacterized protein n=1 Tax=Blastopirellula marina TaxID=124 RepID=A0A2S8GEY1_9BACT|nr:hypothetical protein [Blastopirellula marina]PQO43025.1 hypothetical protein C5Y93_25250 [Blastopirellula marina]